MQLSKRLETVIKQVTKGSRVADIGCDHAYVSIQLMERGVAANVIAMDINKGPLARAKENIRNHGLENSIQIRLSDGASMLNQGEADTLLIGGMGGALTVRILKESEQVVMACKELILQPQSEIFLVREYLHHISFGITHEDMLYEDGQYYVVIKAVNNAGVCGIDRAEPNRIYELYGEHLLREKNSALKEYLQYKLEGNAKLQKNLAGVHTAAAVKRREELLMEQKHIMEGLGYYEM